jgi:mono/diheme cytochrome c family protein
MSRTTLPFALFWLVAAVSGAEGQTVESGAVEFNRDIRPILSDHCFTCHGPDATHRQAGLRFDTPDGPGWVIAAGHPEQSEIIRRITATDGDQMPPKTSGKKPITASEAELIRRWIAQGAQYQPFWSFIPPKRPALPDVANKAWARNPIDRFILARLEREGLHPSPEADKRILIRRVTLDLTGLPPTPTEVEAFVADTSPDAYEKVVDRLLASPRYGERMAFRWMEAARYGDSNGYQTDGPRDMWRWRDWVISAFNGNMPWDQFTVEQLAGDLLPNATLDQRIASGFNRNHRTTGEGGIIDEEYRVEYVADRTQTTATVFMGLTLGCARCHDHKYDPLAQKDFYRLFAYFNQIPGERGFTWNYGPEEPYVKAPLPEQQKQLEAMDAQIEKARLAYKTLDPKIEATQARWERDLSHSSDWTPTDGQIFRSEWVPSKLPPDASPAGKALHFDGKEFLEASGDAADFSYLDPFTFSAWIKPESPDGAILTRLDDFIESQGHGLYLIGGKLRLHLTQRFTDLGLRVETADPVKLNQWQHVLVTYDGKRLARGVKMYVNGEVQPVKVLFDQNTEPFHKKNTPIRVGAGGGLRFKGSIGDARIYNRALSPEEAAALSIAEPLSRIPASGRTKAQQLKLNLAFLETAAPKDVREARAELAALQSERAKFCDSIPTVMVMADGANRDTFVLKRGAYDAHGEKVTAGVPQILPQLPPDLPNNRLGLAKWLVDRSNPLMARVTVNRFWQSYFGFGIVKTVDDFGSQGEWPVNPELLDWLAVEFMDSGWNVKALQKLIVMSAAYRQSSAVTPALLEKDPDNRLLARGPRLRLGPEAIRDQALSVSGLLVEKQGGPSVKPYQPAGLWQELSGNNGYVQEKGDGLYRRSLYTYWKRTIPHPYMMNFDSPNREQCAVYENRTNSPLQALDLMNEVTFVEASRKLAERMMTEGGAASEARLEHGYSLVLARAPSAQQKKVMLRLLGELEKNYKADPKAATDFVHQGESAVPSNLNIAELAAYTGVASLMLNLDEAITKE